MSITTASRAVLRAGVIACLLLTAVALAAHTSEYPLTTRAGLRVHAAEVLPLLGLGVLNLVALDAGPSGRLRDRFIGVAVGNVLFTGAAVRLLGPGAPPFAWLLAGVGALLVVGSIGCAPTPRVVPLLLWKTMLRSLGVLALSLTVAYGAFAQQAAPAASQTRSRNVILVVTDGLRWQEVFGGADSSILFGEPRVVGGDTVALRERFWRPTATARREALLPFLWSVVARNGQLFGNRAEGSSVAVTNGLKFSYPGYNEMLSGFGDPRIDRNDFGVNPNVTVFEWLNRQPQLRGRVAAFATWDVFADIFARDRSGVFVHAGWEPPYASPRSASDSLLNRLYATTYREWGNNAWDAFTHTVAMRYLAQQRPRVAFIGYGETDEWSHASRYDRLLRSARAVDDYLRELWTFLQSHPEYRGRTTLIVTTDHGRGRTARDWTNHGRDVDGAEEMWLAVIGPDTPPLGERRNAASMTQSQIAATIAALLGLDYRRDQARAAEPIGDVIGRK